MDSDGEYVVVKSNVHQAVALPDGKEPLPLGSGSIVGLLGSGGMSNVYKIWCPRMERHRAVKLMKPDLSTESRQRFQTEIRITAALSHPNIIEIHSVGEWNALSYIEMEFIDGATLADCIDKKGALPLTMCSALGILMARALVYAHDKEYVLYGKNYRGLIHRDLKPTNIMIGFDGRVKLMDFGIARPVETSLMTMDGAVMGTMQYLAPEQIDGKNVGVASDLYALGAILYETITGQKAFPQKNLSHLMSAKTANTFTPLKFFKIKMPGQLSALVNKCMQRDPKKRQASAAELLNALESIHCRYTDATPEESVLQFMNLKDDAKTIYHYRRRLLGAYPIPIALSLMVIMLGAALFFKQSTFQRKAPLAQTLSKAPKPDDAPARQKRAFAAIAVSSPKNVSIKHSGSAQKKSTSAARSLQPAPIEKPAGGGDPLESFIKEAEAGKYASALAKFDSLPPGLASNEAARVLRVRSLRALGRSAEALRVLSGEAMDDGEFYLIEARLLLELGETSRVAQCLDKSVTMDARMMEPETFRREYLFCRALCATRQYEESPNESGRKRALDGWFEVKNSLRKYPDHAYFRKAVSEMQKIGAVIPSKG
jgi:serine/threonine protein kinase